MKLHEFCLSEEETQVLDAIRSLELYPEDEGTGKRLTATYENLRDRDKLIQEWVSGKEVKPADWKDAIEGLLKKKLIRSENDIFILTGKGNLHAICARNRRVGKRFSNILIRSEGSAAHSLFCERVFGRDLCQANLMDMKQMEKLLEVLSLSPKNRVLDLGCGIGKIAEYISDLTHASVLGIDIAVDAITHAQARTQQKRNRLDFKEGDLNDLQLPPASVDTIIAIDTLHFVEDLGKTIGQMKAILTPHGQMGLFSFQYCLENDSPDILLPNNTNLARTLKKHDLSFRTWDFTEREKEIWHRERQVATELRDEFQAEGNLDLCEDRIEECEIDLPLVEEGKKRRYLYHVEKVSD
jgi:2-polyprenyl-3-methyl-5-hydroxy-6-metoxy-1,4-benzoquinol methylase